MVAPRPAIWEIGQRDGLMVKEWIPGAWKRIQRAYKALGVKEHLRMDSFDGAHRWNGVKVESVLASVLNP